MSKFTKLPNINDENKKAIKDFIQGAEEKGQEKNTESSYAWEELDDTEKTKGINLRITKADLAKLQYISKNTPYSIQAFCYEFVKKAMEEKLSKIT